MSNKITNSPLNNERFAVTGNSILARNPYTDPTGPTYKHDWTEWFHERERAEAFFNSINSGERNSPTAKKVAEAIHEIDQPTSDALTEKGAAELLKEAGE